MFDTTNQTETFDTMAAESDYSAIFDELIEEAGPQPSGDSEAAFDSETGAKSGKQRPGAAQEDEEDIFADYDAPLRQTKRRWTRTAATGWFITARKCI